jgi:hypothetical protein
MMETYLPQSGGTPMVHTRRLLLAGLSFALFGFTSCLDGPDPGSVWDGSVRDSAGVQIVLNHGAPLWREPDRWVLSETLRIGVPDGEPEYMFGHIDDMGILSDGRIVVADRMAQHLRFFLPDGRWEKTVGRPGSGPGEFGMGSLQVLVGPGDTLLVIDTGNERANKIAPDGTWLDSFLSSPEEGWMFRDWDYSPTGRIVSHMSRVPGMEESESDTLDLVVVRNLGGAPEDTVGVVAASRIVRVSGSLREFFLYAGEPAVSLCPDNSLVTGRGDIYEIKRYDSAGNLEQIVRLDRPNPPITVSDRAFLRTRSKEDLLERGISPARTEEFLSATHFTKTYPAFVTLMCGPRGSIWTQPVEPVSALTEEEREEFSPGSFAEASAHFDVFDRQGRYLGVVPLPQGSWPDRFHEDNLYGRWTDSLDVEYVQGLRLEGFTPESEG